MLVAIKAKDLTKFGNTTLGEYNYANDSLTLWFNSSRFINKDYTLTFPEFDIPKQTKEIHLVDAGGGINITCSVNELEDTLNNGLYNIPYEEWVNTKNTF